MLPNGVSIRRPFPSGMECDSATKLMRNGPSSMLPPRSYVDEDVAAWEAEHVFLAIRQEETARLAARELQKAYPLTFFAPRL